MSSLPDPGPVRWQYHVQPADGLAACGGAAGVALLVGSYTILGGLSSVMWTDAFQCVLLVIGGVVLFFVALGHIPGGWSAMVQAAPSASISTIRPAIRKRRSSVSSRRHLACFSFTNPPTR